MGTRFVDQLLLLQASPLPLSLGVLAASVSCLGFGGLLCLTVSAVFVGSGAFGLSPGGGFVASALPLGFLHTGRVNVDDQYPDAYRLRLEAKFRPERIRATLSFAGLYQMTHELIKSAVLDDVREFYWRGIEDEVIVYDERAYAANVLAKAPGNRFRASLLWLAESQAITLAQVERLDDIYAHRHDLSHQLIKYIVDPDLDPDVALFTDALLILQSVRRFWTSVEKDIGSFEDFGDVNVDEVTPLSLAVLQMCIDAYLAGLPPAE